MRLDAAEKECVTGDAEKEDDGRGDEGGGKGVGRGNDVAGDDRRGDGGELAGQIGDAGESADAVTRGDERGHGPGDWCSRGQARLTPG